MSSFECQEYLKKQLHQKYYADTILIILFYCRKKVINIRFV